MTDNYKACADMSPQNYACERRRGHDGKHRALDGGITWCNPDVEAGERYLPEELPENQMNNSGAVEWVGDDLFALATEDGLQIEFRHALEVTAVYELDGGEVGEVHSGTPRPLGGDPDE